MRRYKDNNKQKGKERVGQQIFCGAQWPIRTSLRESGDKNFAMIVFIPHIHLSYKKTTAILKEI